MPTSTAYMKLGKIRTVVGTPSRSREDLLTAVASRAMALEKITRNPAGPPRSTIEHCNRLACEILNLVGEALAIPVLPLTEEDTDPCDMAVALARGTRDMPPVRMARDITPKPWK